MLRSESENGHEVVRVKIGRTYARGISKGALVISVRTDDPPAYILHNNTNRTMVVRQAKLNYLNSIPVVLSAHSYSCFGWASPTHSRLLEVEMHLSRLDQEKSTVDLITLPLFGRDENKSTLSKTFPIEDVFGSIASISMGNGEVGFQASLDLHGTTKVIRFDNIHNRSAWRHTNKTSIDFPYSVSVRAVEAWNIELRNCNDISEPVGKPFLRVSVDDHKFMETCNGTESNTVNFESASELFGVKWLQPAMHFKCLCAPKQVHIVLFQKFGNRCVKLGHKDINLREIMQGEMGRVPSQFTTGIYLDDCPSPGKTRISIVIDVEEFSLHRTHVPSSFLLKLKGIGLSLISKSIEEGYVCVENIQVAIIEKPEAVSQTVRIGRIQVLNQAPVVKNRIVLSTVREDLDTLQLHALIKRGEGRSNLLHLENVDVLLPELIVRLEETFIKGLFNVFQGLLTQADDIIDGINSAKIAVQKTTNSLNLDAFSAHSDTGSGWSNTLFLKEDAEDGNVYARLFKIEQGNQFCVFIEKLHIYHIKITLSFFFRGIHADYYFKPNHDWDGLVSGLGQWSDVTMRFDAFYLENVYGPPKAKLVPPLAFHYVKALSKQTWKGFLALDIIGNPQHIVDRLASAIVQFSNDPIMKLQQNGLASATVSCRDASVSEIGLYRDYFLNSE